MKEKIKKLNNNLCYLIIILLLISFLCGELYMKELINNEIKTELQNIATYKCQEKIYNFTYKINLINNSFKVIKNE